MFICNYGKKRVNLLQAVEFDGLKRRVIETVLSAAGARRSGKANADPCEAKACEYCKMKAVCRAKK